MNSNGPIFIMGCSRAGTTLLQSLVATHSGCFAFPEAGLLFKVADDIDLRRYGYKHVNKSVARRQRIKGYANRVGLTRNFNWTHDFEKLPDFLKTEVANRKLGREIFIRRIYDQFASMLTEVSSGRRWIEKSPQNIFVLDYLEKYFSNASFIHIVRSPIANIASLIDAAQKYQSFATRFAGAHGLDKAINYYNNALLWSASRKASDRHLILRYEALADDVDVYLKIIERFLSFDKGSLKPIYDISNIADGNEIWKRNHSHVARSKDKSKRVFNISEIDYVKRNTLHPNRWFQLDDREPSV